MQEENETIRDFLKRTDALAAQLGVPVEGLIDYIGISRASLFSYRTGKRKISSKAWAKLAAAEARAENAQTEMPGQRRAEAARRIEKVVEAKAQYGAGPEAFNAWREMLRSFSQTAREVYPDDTVKQTQLLDTLLAHAMRAIDAQDQRLTRIETKLDALLKHEEE